MVEQQKYGEILSKIIDQTKSNEIQTSEQLIEVLISELKTSKLASQV